MRKKKRKKKLDAYIQNKLEINKLTDIHKPEFKITNRELAKVYFD